MKFRKPAAPTQSEQKEIYHLASSIMATSDGVDVGQAVLISKRILEMTRAWPDRTRRRLVFRSVSK